MLTKHDILAVANLDNPHTGEIDEDFLNLNVIEIMEIFLRDKALDN